MTTGVIIEASQHGGKDPGLWAPDLSELIGPARSLGLSADIARQLKGIGLGYTFT